MKLENRDHSSDEQLLDQVIADFLRADSVERGEDRQRWLDRYPACAAGLLEFFRHGDHAGSLGGQLLDLRRGQQAVLNQNAGEGYRLALEFIALHDSRRPLGGGGIHPAQLLGVAE